MVKSRYSTPKTPPDPEDLIPTWLGWIPFAFTDGLLNAVDCYVAGYKLWLTIDDVGGAMTLDRPFFILF